MSRRSSPLAGFQVTFIGRIWVTAEDHSGGNLAFHDGVEVPDTSLVIYEYDALTFVLEQTWWAPYMKKTPESIGQSGVLLPEWFPFNDSVVQIYGTNGLMLLGRHEGGWQL